jgi:hypothetical protein
MRPDEDHDGRVTREYLFNCLQLVEPVHGTRGSSGAALDQKTGAGAHAIHDGPGAALSRETRARAAGTCGGPGAASSRETGAEAIGTRGAPGAALSWEADTGAAGTRDGPGAALHFVLTLSLYAGYPILMVPTVAPGPTLGEAANPQVGPTSFPM